MLPINLYRKCWKPRNVGCMLLFREPKTDQEQFGKILLEIN